LISLLCEGWAFLPDSQKPKVLTLDQVLSLVVAWDVAAHPQPPGYPQLALDPPSRYRQTVTPSYRAMRLTPLEKLQLTDRDDPTDMEASELLTGGTLPFVVYP